MYRLLPAAHQAAAGAWEGREDHDLARALSFRLDGITRVTESEPSGSDSGRLGLLWHLEGHRLDTQNLLSQITYPLPTGSRPERILQVRPDREIWTVNCERKGYHQCPRYYG